MAFGEYMERLFVAALSAALSVFPICSAAEEIDSYGRLPRQYWEYMEGYKYQYSENCLVGWHARSASFLIQTSCPELSDDKLNSDAIKSIKYAQGRSRAKNFSEYYAQFDVQKTSAEVPYSREHSIADAKSLWRKACLGAKELRSVPFFELADQYRGINRVHAARLFSNARDTVLGLGGFVNCAEQANYAVEVYAADVDIRAESTLGPPSAADVGSLAPGNTPYSVEQSEKDAREIWRLSCTDAKSRTPSRLDTLASRFNKIQKEEVAQLHRNAYAAVEAIDRLSGGNIDCEKAANLLVPDRYVLGRDIRSKEYRQ